MKTITFTAIIASILTILSPVLPMIILAILMVIIDTGFGMWRTVKLKGWDDLLSKKFSDIFGKIIIYSLAILVTYFIEMYIAKDIIAEFISVELFMTKVVAGAVVYTEIKSIDEKYEQVKKKSFLRGLRKIVTRAKEEKDNLIN
jgi:heme/copper-type cytochrome/quinol oxidase subunit 1